MANAYLIIFISILTYDCIWSIISLFVAGQILNTPALYQCLSQDLETGCLKLAVVKVLGVQIFKGDHNINIFQS